MTLGLTPEGYVVYMAGAFGESPFIASINGNLLFLKSFNDAKDSIPIVMQDYIDGNGYAPHYVWIEPISRFWHDGVQQ